MCGIVGFVDPQRRTPEPARVLLRMRETLAHRGPDDAGEVVCGSAWLAHRRLSIVDLSCAGRQPFVVEPSPGRRVAALANGEIYNHAELRPAIEERWPDVRLPASDCAVLPWLFAAHGADMPRRLLGMYGLAAWDERSETLLLARDPAGQKPLYYGRLPGGGIAFASEPKALVAHPLIGREVDPLALRRYLAFGYVPGAATIYRGIRRLGPGAHLVWRRGRVTLGRHFDVPREEPALPPAEAAHQLWTAIGDAVEARLMADVPLGVFLSGGLDSTAVVAALAERTDPTRLDTFAVGFESPTFDESGPARFVAQHFGTRHHEQRLDAATLVRLVPDILAKLDEPFADASIVPTYLLSRFAREHVTVALGGDGGDELLLGYPTFWADGPARLAAALLPRSLRRRVVEPLVGLWPVSTDHMSLGFKLERFLSGLDLPSDHRHPVWVGGIAPRLHGQALAPGLAAQAPDAALFADVDDLAARFSAARPGGSRPELLGWEYFHTYLSDCVLTKVDRASMAHALEVRAPLLDPRVLRAAWRLPLRAKLAGTTTKRVLRQILAERLPPQITRRPKKGFGIPVAEWLRGPLRGWMTGVLDPVAVRRGGLLDPRWTSRLAAEHTSGRADHHKALWIAIALELWRSGPYGPSA